MKKIMALTILIFTIFSLAGCSFINWDVSGLLRAPMIPKESLKLQAALDKALGKDSKYIFPQSGNHKSSIVQRDMNGDSKDEAIVFYFSDAKGKTARILVLTDNGDKWDILCDIEGHGSDIDIVSFIDFNNDGKEELIIGWLLYTNEGKGLSVYDIFSGVGAKEIYSTPYTEMLLLKNAVSTAPALLSVNLNTHKRTSVAKLTMYKDKELKDITSCEMDGTLTSHKNITEAYVSDKNKGIIVDGETNGTYSTQILFWNGKELTNPYYKNKQLNELLVRNNNLLCTDIDKDGIIEIPRGSSMPGINVLENYKSTLINIELITWNEWDSNKILKSDFSAVMNPEQHYYFKYPKSFIGNVTVKKEPIAQRYIFYVISSDTTSNEELFSISVLNIEDWNNRNEQGGWIELRRDSKVVYAASIPRTQSKKAKELMSNINISENFVIMAY